MPHAETISPALYASEQKIRVLVGAIMMEAARLDIEHGDFQIALRTLTTDSAQFAVGKSIAKLASSMKEAINE